MTRSAGSGRAARSSSPSPARGRPWASARRGAARDGWPVEVVTAARGRGREAPRGRRDGGQRAGRLRVERGEPLVAIGGGALGDAAGFLAAIYLRGVPFIQVPTTLVAQIDSSIGGKTGVDLPEGKNLVGAFHQPAAIVIDIAVLRTLPERQRRAALGEAVKMAALGDERLFELLETDGPAIARGDPAAFDLGRRGRARRARRVGQGRGGHAPTSASAARAAGRISAQPRSLARPRRRGGRRATAGCSTARPWPTGCARPAGSGRGRRDAAGAGRPDRAPARRARARRREPLPYPLDAVLDHLATDKKHAAGRLRWVLPTATGVEVRSDVPD